MKTGLDLWTTKVLIKKITYEQQPRICFYFNRDRVSSVGRALDYGAEGRGFDSRGQTKTQHLKITKK